MLFKADQLRYAFGKRQKARPVTKTALPLALTAALTLSGCSAISESRLNPFNWFGSSVTSPVTASGELLPLIPAGTRFGEVENRGLIDQVADLQIERVPSGAIVRATGVANTLGQYNAELVNEGITDGVLTLTFRVAVPASAQSGGTQRSREITVARTFSQNDLAGVRSIRVQAAQNIRTSSPPTTLKRQATCTSW